MYRPKLRQLWQRNTWFGGADGSVAKLMTGSVASQMLLVAVSPIITRIYSPADLGALAAFVALASVLALVATGAYAQAVVLPREDTRAVNLALVGLCVTVTVSLISLVFVVAALIYPQSTVAEFTWLLWLPLAVLVGGANAVLVAYANRERRYGLIASTSVIRAGCQAIGQVGLGLLVPSAGSLVGATTVASAAGSVRLSRNFLQVVRRTGISKASMVSVAREYSAFPRHTLPAGLLSQVQFSGLPLIIGAMFGASTLGLWSLAQRIVSMPLSLIGGAVADVYYRRAVDVRESREAALGLYRRVLFRLALLSLPPFVLLAVFAPAVFAFVFGPDWDQAGVYARIMIPLLWVRFLANPVSRTTLVYARNRLGLLIQMALASVVALCTITAWAHGWDFVIFLSVFSWVAAAVYVAALVVYARIISVS